jgi:glycosyltransferase involved in cell wall biosynthesis
MINVVVPVFNEGENIKMLFDQLQEKVHTPIEVLVVYDFEEDNTCPVVRKICNDYGFKITLVKNLYGRGALNAIKTGLKTSDKEAVLVLMADLSDSIEVVDVMYDKIMSGFDVVCGSRYMKGGRQIGGPFLKKLFSRTAGVTLHYIIRIPTHDISNSFKMYSRRVIDTFEIESNGGFELGMELTVKSYVNGFKVTEVPSNWYDRAAGKSNFKMWQWIPKYLKWYMYGVKGTVRGICRKTKGNAA